MFLCEVFSLIMSGQTGPLASPHVDTARLMQASARLLNDLRQLRLRDPGAQLHYYICSLFPWFKIVFYQAFRSLNPFVAGQFCCNDNNNALQRVVLRSWIN